MQTIESMEIIRLNAAESLAMAEAILNPGEPNDKVRAAAKCHARPAQSGE